MAIITKKDGRIYCVWRGDDGKQTWESFGRGSEAKNKANIRDLEVKLHKAERPKLPPPGNPNDLTFQALSQAYTNARKTELATKTFNEIFRAIKDHALPVIGNIFCSKITMTDLSNIEQRLLLDKDESGESKEPLSATTVNRYTHYIAKVFSWGVEKELIRVHPWPNRKNLRTVQKFKIDLFSLEEFQSILAVAPDHLRWALELEYHTGARPGPTELLNLKWTDINWKTGGIRIYSSKTDSTHMQYVSKEFRDRMSTRMKIEKIGYPDCPYICHYEGAKIRSLKRSWDTAKKNAGIDKRIRLYDIRHFYVTHALAAGANILDLAQRVGHVNADMIVRVYGHLAKEVQKKEALKIPELYSQRTPENEAHDTAVNNRANKKLTKIVDSQQKGVTETP